MTKALVISWNNRKGVRLALLLRKEQELWSWGRMNFTLHHFCSLSCTILPGYTKGETGQEP